MSGQPGTKPPTFAFYADTCFYRTEHFLHDQMTGIVDADVRAIARWGNCLDEFPIRSLFLVEEFRSRLPRIRNALRRRIFPGGHDAPWGRLPSHAVRRIADNLRRHPVDLIYCLFGWHAAQLLDVLDRLDRPVPLVFLAGGSDITAAASFGEDYRRRLMRACDRASVVLAGSSFLKDRLLDLGVDGGKVAVHHIGLRLPPVDGIEEDRGMPGFRALAVSRLSPVKGLRHTIRAFAGVAREIPDATLDIIGDGEERRECEGLIEDLSLSGRARLLGSLPLPAVYEAMRRSHVFLQHNVRAPGGSEESIGGSILEASAHKLPVIVTRSGGVLEAVEGGVTGLIVDPGDEAAMAAGLVAMARDPVRRARMGEAGRLLVERKFNLREQNRRLSRILLGACQENRK